MNEPKLKFCSNCQTIVVDRFCPHCGQEWNPTGLTLKIFLREYLERSFGIDSKFRETLKTLFLFPGKMTVDYVSGRRQHYMNPIKFYFACSLAFLFCLTRVPGLQILISQSGISILTVSRPEFVVKSQLGIPQLDVLFSTLTDRSEVVGHAGVLLLLTIPLTAVLLKLLFSQTLLVHHLVFSFHFHSLGLLVLMPGFIPWKNAGYHDIFNTFLTLLTLSFLGRMLKTTYALSTKKLFVTLPLCSGFYILTFLGLAFLKVIVGL